MHVSSLVSQTSQDTAETQSYPLRGFDKFLITPKVCELKNETSSTIQLSGTVNLLSIHILSNS